MCAPCDGAGRAYLASSRIIISSFECRVKRFAPGKNIPVHVICICSSEGDLLPTDVASSDLSAATCVSRITLTLLSSTSVFEPSELVAMGRGHSHTGPRVTWPLESLGHDGNSLQNARYCSSALVPFHTGSCSE